MDAKDILIRSSSESAADAASVHPWPDATAAEPTRVMLWVELKIVRKALSYMRLVTSSYTLCRVNTKPQNRSWNNHF